MPRDPHPTAGFQAGTDGACPRNRHANQVGAFGARGRPHEFCRLEPSLELALTGRIVPELEAAVLRTTGPEAWKTSHAG